MKISKLFHWLYASVMFLPILLLPVFMIYSHRHTIDSGTLEVPQNEIVDFNQLVEKRDYNFDYLGVTIESDNDGKYVLNGTCTDNVGFNVGSYDFLQNHKYLYTGLNSPYSTDYASLGYADYNYNGDSIFNCSSDFTGYYVYFLNNGNTYTNLVFYPQIFDLTKMFGAGNEPTASQFRSWYSNTYYDYTLSRKELLKEVSTITYSDTDIMSQATYQLYSAVDKYFNISQFFGLNNLWDYMVLNWFGGNVTIYLQIFWQLLCYWLVVSIAWLIFDLFMYVPNLAHRWLDKGAIE